MALVVEDGTGKSNAESYVSVAEADARHLAFGNTGWTGADAAKEAALRRATAYMMASYRTRWLGTRVRHDQALDWPRYIDGQVDGWWIDSNVVPAEIRNACADLALRALAEDLAPDLERGVVREKVGPLEVEYDRASPQAKRFRAVEMMLAPYLRGSSATATLVRS